MCIRDRSCIKGFHAYTVLNHPTIKDPAVSIRGFQQSKHLPVYCTKQDLETLFASFDQSDKGIYEKTILEVLYGCGLRVSELCTLTTNQIHYDQKILRIHGKGDKERIVPMADAVSYTHLDVYKRQLPSKIRWENGTVYRHLISRPGSP